MKKFAFKVFLTFFVIFALSCSFSASANFNNKELDDTLTNNNYFMLNVDTGKAVLAKGQKEHVQPAAMTKLLASVYAFYNWGSLDENIVITNEDLSLMPNYYGIRRVGFSAGDSYSKRQLIQAALIYSANDAMSVIAYRLSGSNESFASTLNTFAQSFGCKDTNIVDPYGFDVEGQYTCARDVAKFMAKGLKNADFSDAIQMSTLTLPASTNTSEKTFETATMMTYSASSYYHASVKGGKETLTDGAGRCTAVYSVQDGYSYVTVVMNGKAETDAYGTTVNTANTDIKKMLDWVYKNISIKSVAEAGAVLATLPVQGGKKTDTVQLTVKKTVSALVLNNVTSNSVLTNLEEGAKDLKLVAPIREGDVICKADIIYANETIATVDLVAATTVTLSTGRLILQKLSNFLMNGVVIFIEVVVLIVLGALFAHYVLLIRAAKHEPDMTVLKKEGENVEDPQREKVIVGLSKAADSAKKAFAKAKSAAGGLSGKLKRTPHEGETKDFVDEDEEDEDEL